VQQVSGNTVMQSATTEVTVSSSGLAQCGAAAKGTFTVFATILRWDRPAPTAMRLAYAEAGAQFRGRRTDLPVTDPRSLLVYQGLERNLRGAPNQYMMRNRMD